MANKESSRGTAEWQTLAAVLVMLAAAYFTYQTFLARQPAAQANDGKIGIFSDASPPLLEGTAITARAFSSCGNFEIYLDGKKLSEGSTRAEATVTPLAGKHTLEAKNAECKSVLEFVVRAKECSGNENRNCVIGSCPGIETCAGGIYQECVLLKKTCVPGQTVGCSLDACKFGYATCNECGTAFGPCLPSSEKANASCNANVSCT